MNPPEQFSSKILGRLLLIYNIATGSSRLNWENFALRKGQGMWVEGRAFQYGRWKVWKARLHWKIVQIDRWRVDYRSRQRENAGKCNIPSISIFITFFGWITIEHRVHVPSGGKSSDGCGGADDEGNTPIKEVAGCVLRSTRTSCRDKFVSPDVQMRRILMILVFNEIITVPHTVH